MMKLDPIAAKAGVRLVAHGAVGSTNAEAMDLARKEERGPLWITAEQQSAGRGRRGRNWTSQRGNLYASLLLTSPAPPERWPELSFVAALAIHDAVVELVPEIKPRLAIKWPNDVLIEGAKFAGILIEGDLAGEGAVAVGIGVNCASHPKQTEYPATDLLAAGANVKAPALFAALSRKMLGRLAQWNGGEGFATIRTDWLARTPGIGGDIRVRLTDREINGRFESLDNAGRLVLALPDGSTELIAAGDVFPLSAASPPPGRETDT